MRMKIWYHPPSNNGKRSMAILLKSNYDYIVSQGSSTSIVPRFLGNELLFAPRAPYLSTFSTRNCIMKSAITRWKWSPLKKPSFDKSSKSLTNPEKVFRLRSLRTSLIKANMQNKTSTCICLFDHQGMFPPFLVCIQAAIKFEAVTGTCEVAFWVNLLPNQEDTPHDS